MQAMTLLLNRNSHPKLEAPAPAGEALERIYQAALRAPDHGNLTPWQIIEFCDEGQNALGELFAQAKIFKDPDTSIETLTRLRNMPKRAPLVIAVVAKIQDASKIPVSEQRLSAACVAHGLLLATEAEGFAAIWRSGWVCFDNQVKAGLKLDVTDEIIGFIYLGSAAGDRKPLPNYAITDFVTRWS